MSIEALVTTFVLGVAAAASPCLLPLYPGYLAYLAAGPSRPGSGRASMLLGIVVVAGVLTAIMVVGLVVSALAMPLSEVLAIVVPATTMVLVTLGLVMLAGRNPFARLASIRIPVVRRHPAAQAFTYGLAMGPVAIPCAGPFFVALLAISVGIGDTGARIGSFIVFGLGFGLPLIVLAAIGAARGQAVARTIARHHDIVVRVAGALLIVAALAEPIRLATTAT